MTRRRDSERGAILVYVAIAILALMSFSAFVMDYGVFWVARHQAQNAADAGALAGAFARVFEEPIGAGAMTDTAARSAASANGVFGQVPSVDVQADPGTCPAFMTATGDTCVRVDVYRDAAHSNPLPTYFARLFGISELGVQATATAQLRGANLSDCLKPLMLPDIGG